MYYAVSSSMSDSKNGVQGPAGTSASVPNQHARKEDRMHHAWSPLIRIPKTFCLLHATGSARKMLSPIAAWLQNCAAASGHNDTPPCERMVAHATCKPRQSGHLDARLGLNCGQRDARASLACLAPHSPQPPKQVGALHSGLSSKKKKILALFQTANSR
jgi:hypothetical protein